MALIPWFKGWLARALNAPRGPQWVCESCHNIHAEWVPVCDNCQSFDTLSWKAPPAADVSSPTGVAMLPLIVGAPDEPAQEAELVVQEDIADAIEILDPVAQADQSDATEAERSPEDLVETAEK